ncbi:MAG: hypothetical protein AAF327_16710 [Cyanobacteria bacterium P01_A01_bin.37]
MAIYLRSRWFANVLVRNQLQVVEITEAETVIEKLSASKALDRSFFTVWW